MAQLLLFQKIKTNMKNKLIMAAATIAGALLVTYLFWNKESGKPISETAPVKKSHHLTDVFAHAKNYYIKNNA